jgi:FeS assembly SUF system regulator
MVLMTHMARHADRQPRNARELAAEAHLPVPTASKILKILARAGLLAAHRGAKGGFSLARPAAEVSVADVIRALDGPISLTECGDHLSGACELELLCPIGSNWRRINLAVRQALEGISLAEMAQPLPGLTLLAARAAERGAAASRV